MSETNEQGPVQPSQGDPPPPGAPSPEGDQGQQAGPQPAGAEGPLPTFMWKPREEQFLGEMKADDKTMGMLCHLLALSGLVTAGAGFILGPLIIWLIKKDSSPYVDVQGKESVNFELSMLIYGAAVGVVGAIGFFILPCLAIPLAVALGIFVIVMVIIASMKANQGIIYRYPLCIRFIK